MKEIFPFIDVGMRSFNRTWAGSEDARPKATVEAPDVVPAVSIQLPCCLEKAVVVASGLGNAVSLDA